MGDRTVSCENGGIKDCMKESVLYSIKCLECKKKEVTSEYWGETGRDGHTRGGEHLCGLRDRLEENPLWKHLWERHGGEGARIILR